MSVETALYGAAGGALALFLLLGVTVARAEHGQIDAVAAAARGHGTRLAAFFTFSGRNRFLTASFIVAIVVFAVLRKPLWIPLVILISQLLTQGIAELFKLAFARARPERFLIRRDRGHSFPSGHATTAIVFFTGWAIVVLFTSMPPPLKEGIAAILTAWALAIDWSRLALGAHYLSDVIAGTILGAGWMCLAIALVHHFASPFVL